MSFHLPGVKPGSDLESLFKAIGFVVVQWGHAEQTLDLIANTLFRDFDGKRFAKRIPKMLETKLKFVRDCLSNTPSLDQFRPDCESLIDRFDRLSRTRHAIVHGAIESFSSKSSAFTFAKLGVDGDTHRVRQIAFDSVEFPSLIRELLRLGADANKLARKIWDSAKEHQ